jgi:hypothetical protein
VVNYTGGLSLGDAPLKNEIWSPEIYWDLPGPEDDDPYIADCAFAFDTWVHLPWENGIYFSFASRTALAGQEFGEWRRGFGRAGDPSWQRLWAFIYPIPANVERLQVALGVFDYAELFELAGNAATPSPMFDNVHVYKLRVDGIVLESAPYLMAGDGFPVSGAVDVSTPAARDLLDVPFDMATNTNSGDLILTAGDSIAVGVYPLIDGVDVADLRMKWALKKNPFFEDDIRAVPSRPRDENVDTSAGNIWTGDVLGLPCTNDVGDTIDTRFFFDLPDVDFLYPGDVLEYYIQATDTNGRLSTFPWDTSGFGEFTGAFAKWLTVRAVPTIQDVAGTQPPILVVNHVTYPLGDYLGYSVQSELGHSLNHLGLQVGRDFDEFTRRATGGNGADGIGGAGAHGATAPQLEGYSTILFMGGMRGYSRLSDGSNVGSNNKCDDIGVLEAWHALPGTRNIAYFGGRLAQQLSENTPDGFAYLTSTMGVSFEAEDVKPAIGGLEIPIVRPADPAFTTEYATTFLCHEPLWIDGNYVRHNHVTPGPDSFYGHQFVNPSTGEVIDGPAASIIYPNPNPGVTGYDVLFPYSIIWIRNDLRRSPVGMSDRTLLIAELLTMFGQSPSGGAVVSAPEMATLDLSVTPNPFNPRTTIRFDVGVGQRGDVKVYNVRGELVRTLHEGEYVRSEFTWDGTDHRGGPVASGVYVVKATADGQSRVSKVALIR